MCVRNRVVVAAPPKKKNSRHVSHVGVMFWKICTAEKQSCVLDRRVMCGTLVKKKVVFRVVLRVAVLPKCRAGPYGMLGVCWRRGASSHRSWVRRLHRSVMTGGGRAHECQMAPVPTKCCRKTTKKRIGSVGETQLSFPVSPPVVQRDCRGFFSQFWDQPKKGSSRLSRDCL